jgi:hypothetical protein
MSGHSPSPAPSATFAVTADLCPQILCRLLGMIAQQGRMVERLEAQSGRGNLRIRFSVSDIEQHHAEILAAKMRSLVSVRAVWLSWVGLAVSAPAVGPDADLPALAPELCGRAMVAAGQLLMQ